LEGDDDDDDDNDKAMPKEVTYTNIRRMRRTLIVDMMDGTKVGAGN
jgi:hypothetical protein